MLQLSGGGLSFEPKTPVTVGSNNRVTVPSWDPFGSKMAIDAATGRFTGSMMLPSEGRRRAFSGVFIQEAGGGLAEGCFAGESKAGRVQLIPSGNPN